MAMAASGANGSTRDQILHALGLTRAGANFSSAVGELQQTLNRVEGVKLACANNIFPANKLSLKETYMQTMQRDYKWYAT
jgi:serine protease inhibitor